MRSSILNFSVATLILSITTLFYLHAMPEVPTDPESPPTVEMEEPATMSDMMEQPLPAATTDQPAMGMGTPGATASIDTQPAMTIPGPNSPITPIQTPTAFPAITPQPIGITPIPQASPVPIGEQLTWPNTSDLSEQKPVMISSPGIAKIYNQSQQTCKLMDGRLKEIEQSVSLVKNSATDRLQSASTTVQSINVDFGQYYELFNPEKK